MRNDHERAGQNPCTSPTGDGSSYDECNRIGGNAADETSELKDCERREEGPFDVEHCKDPSIQWLQCSCRDEIRATIPTHVIIRIEVIGYAGDSLSQIVNISSGSQSWRLSRTVATMVRSNDTRNTEAQMPNVRIERAIGPGYSCGSSALSTRCTFGRRALADLMGSIAE